MTGRGGTPDADTDHGDPPAGDASAGDALPPAGDRRLDYGEVWTYESIVTALPGANLSPAFAVALQIALFEAGVLLFAQAYGLWDAALAGTAAVFVAAVGSYLMLRIAEGNRTLDAPDRYRRLLFGSSVEVVLAVLAFCAFVTYLFVFEPRHVGDPLPATTWFPVPLPDASTTLLADLFGPEPPVPAVFLCLLVLWDLCYRIGTSWWTAVVSLYSELRLPLSPEAAAEFRRLDYLNVAFATTQLVLVPFVSDRPALVVAVCGHVVAVAAVSASAVALSFYRRRE